MEGMLDHLNEDWGQNDKHKKIPSNAEAMELVLVCAQDIVNAWPQITLRTFGQMTKRIDTLKQALEAMKK